MTLPPHSVHSILAMQGVTPNLQQLEMITEVIAYKFKVPIPPIRISKSPFRGWYHWDSGRITVSGRYRIDCLLHEMAHHIHHLRLGSPPADERKNVRDRTNPRSHHGNMFCEILYDVILFYYVDTEYYGWDKEYKKVQLWFEFAEIGHWLESKNCQCAPCQTGLPK